MTSIFLVTEHDYEGVYFRSAWSTREAAEAEVQRLGEHHDIDEVLLDIPWGGYDIGPRKYVEPRDWTGPSTIEFAARVTRELLADDLVERSAAHAACLDSPYFFKGIKRSDG